MHLEEGVTYELTNRQKRTGTLAILPERADPEESQCLKLSQAKA
jgi:hypothetical protein